MEQLTNNLMSSAEVQTEALRRRQLLKAIAAAGGTVATTLLLPGQWTSPVIEMGYLPVHAQVSLNLPPLACIEAGQKEGIDVILALDKSGSISVQEEIRQQDLNNAKEALKRFVDGLDLTKDQVGLVSFETTATLDHPLTQDGGAIKAAIEAVISGNLTDIAGAIREGDAELSSPHRNPANRPVLLLLSDGAQTVAGDPVADANTAKGKGIRIVSVGLGFFIDAATLQAIASASEDFYFAPVSVDLITIFDPGCNL